ncbi:MAG TPA: DUF4012 domain-containing protein, partial [Acidimicrobiales bacterium]|nr:DUF4012 domain-containing protein [Acidimicrobiales bacterium]
PGASLRVAGRDFDAAHGALDSPLLAPVEIVPVIGRQLRSLQALSGAAALVSNVGSDAIAQAHSILDAPHSDSLDRLSTLRTLSRLATVTDRRLARIDTGPSVALIGPLAARHGAFERDLATLRARLQRAAATTTTVADILQGPQRYLLLMANNAEMRAGSGSFLSIGVLDGGNGTLHLSDVQPTGGLTLPPAGVPVSADLQRLWGWARPGADARNLGLTPQFDVNGPLAAGMWQASTGQQVDGVLAVDVLAFQQILQVTGPVTLPDGTNVGAGNVVSLLTHDQYAGLSDTAGSVDTQARADQLNTLAHSALDALQAEPLDLRTLADAMTTIASGRHLLAWSARPQAQEAWEGAGVAGTITANTTMAAIVNRGGNKLDQYLSVDVTLKLVPRDGGTDAMMTFDLANRTPLGQSQYIAGPYPGIGTVYGEYRGLLALNLPADASIPTLASGRQPVAVGAEGPAWLISTEVDVLAGQNEQLVVHFRLPRHGSMTVAPSARLVPEVWDAAGVRFTDAAPATIRW